MAILEDSKTILITLDQAQLKTVCARFHADRTKPQGGVQKSRFSSFRNVAKINLGGNGRGLAHVIQLLSCNVGIQKRQTDGLLRI